MKISPPVRVRRKSADGSAVGATVPTESEKTQCAAAHAVRESAPFTTISNTRHRLPRNEGREGGEITLQGFAQGNIFAQIHTISCEEMLRPPHTDARNDVVAHYLSHEG